MAIAFFAVCLSACGTDPQENETNKRHIITTIFPEYDWVLSILGENPADMEVTMLLDNGVDLHSFQPTAADILAISTCDLFIYVGGESDEWVEDALQQESNPDRIVVNLLETLGEDVKVEEVVEGMQADHDHDHEGEDHDHEGEEHEHEHEAEYDEHVWLSLKNTVKLAQVISDAMISLDPANAEIYQKNTKDFVEKCKALDEKYQKAVKTATYDTVLFGDRFPFRYMTDDYGLNYYAAFVGCSAETEASFETIVFLAQKMDALSLPAILTIEGTTHKIAQTIVENTQAKNQTILVMDSMQSVTSKDVQNGASYLSIMEKNLEVLKNAIITPMQR